MKGENYSRTDDVIRCQSRISLTKGHITDSFGIGKHPHSIESSSPFGEWGEGFNVA